MSISVFVAGTVDCVYPRPVVADTIDQVCEFLDRTDVRIIDFEVVNSYDTNKNYLRPTVKGYDLNQDYRSKGMILSSYNDYSDPSKGIYYIAEINIYPRYLLHAKDYVISDTTSSNSKALRSLVDELIKHNSRGSLVVMIKTKDHQKVEFSIAI